MRFLSRARPDVTNPVAEQGYSYIALLLMVAVMGAMLASAGVSWSHSRQREKEVELLFIGEQFRNALRSYYNEPIAGAHIYPRRLEDLLHDPRLAVSRRHLRAIYIDPMTGHNQWGLVTLPDGSIIGVHSLSETKPINRMNFTTTNKSFENQARYSDWKFVYKPADAQFPAASPALSR